MGGAPPPPLVFAPQGQIRATFSTSRRGVGTDWDRGSKDRRGWGDPTTTPGRRGVIPGVTASWTVTDQEARIPDRGSWAHGHRSIAGSPGGPGDNPRKTPNHRDPTRISGMSNPKPNGITHILSAKQCPTYTHGPPNG